MFTKKHQAQENKGNKGIAKATAKHTKKTGMKTNTSPGHTA